VPPPGVQLPPGDRAELEAGVIAFGKEITIAKHNLASKPEMLKLLPYDLVFMDCQMPEMDGYEAVAHIRKMEGANQRVRVVAMTAEAIAGCRERCLDAGMDDYVTKPLSMEPLIQAVRNGIRPLTVQ